MQIGFTQSEMETKEQIEMFSRMASLIPLENAEALVRKIKHVDAFAPFIDPTAYLQVRHNIPDHLKVAEAFLAFRRALEEFRPTKKGD